MVERFFEQHGLSRTADYRIWCGMKSRCYNRNNDHYKDYGGRGINVCDRWLHSYAAFLEDMGPRPRGMTIERVDNNKGYSPENCVWADRRTQQNNRRTRQLLTVGQETYNLTEWSRRTGISFQTLKYRIDSGWGPREVVSIEVGGIAPGRAPLRSGVKGVVPQGKRWGALIWSKGKSVWLGTFDTKEQAAVARASAELKKAASRSKLRRLEKRMA